MIVAEVLRPDVIQINQFLVELLVLLGAIVECYGQLYRVHDNQPVDYNGHDHTRICGVSRLAFKCQLRLMAKHVESFQPRQQAFEMYSRHLQYKFLF